jgi:hypothetical protein
MRSSGAAAVTQPVAPTGLPVQASSHEAASGRYTSRSRAPYVVTGATSTSGPNMNWSVTSQAGTSSGNSRKSARIGGSPFALAVDICSRTYGRSRSRSSSCSRITR